MVVKELMRYAHSEGHVDLCFDESGEQLLTGGSDGDVRIYRGFDDEDPVSHRVGDIVYALAQQGGRFFVAADDNAVQAYLLKEGEPDGLIVRFTAHATHICINSTGTLLIVGASDFTIKVVDLVTNSHRTVTGHSAPVLSVALHPKELFLASSSCDGTVRIVQQDDLKVVKVIAGLPKSNDFINSKTLCRLAFDKAGEYLFIPMDKSVKVFDTKNWNEAFELSDSSIVQVLSIICLSSCGKYLAAAARDGRIVVWEIGGRKVILREKHDKSRPITSLVWNPRRYDLAYCDNMGYAGLLKDVVDASILNNSTTPSSVAPGEVDFETASDLFDDADDEAFAGAIPGVDTDIEDDDDASSVVKVTQKQMPTIRDDDDNTDRESVLSARDTAIARVPVVSKSSWEPVPLQRPFQSASCPVSVSTRFMVWNSVGIVTQYNTEEEESIDIEFHDTATHHAIHINNTQGHTMADVSAEALLLASEADGDTPSQLVCMHFGSWDSCTEWNTVMPKGEDIMAICLGDGWLAVATDQRLVRLFSIGGLQRRVFRLPGPAITMAAHLDMLLIVYHSGIGVPGDQCLSFQLLNLSAKKMLCSDRLPLSTKSTLVWIGFSGEGSPFAVDSSGVVQMLNRNFCNAWTTVVNLRDHCKGKTDNYWVVGVRENPLQLRAILCKGARYPPILPRPTMQLIPFQIPLCELGTDKGSLEEQFWRTNLFGEHFSLWAAEGYEFDETEKQRLMLAEQELLMKQFALACKTRREFRAVEICQLMSTCRAVQLAIKYATQTGLIQLAQRLGEVAQQKTEAEESSMFTTNEPVADFSSRSGTVKPFGKRGTRLGSIAVQQQDSEEENDADGNDGDELMDGEDEEDGDTETNTPMNGSSKLLLPIRRDSKSKEPARSLSTSQASTSNKNPFKVSSISSSVKPATAANQLKGTSIFDSMEKSKPGRGSNSFALKQPIRDSKPSSNRKTTEADARPGLGRQASTKKGTSQAKLFGLTKANSQPKDNKEEEEEESGARVPKTGFQMWFEANRESLLTESSDLEEDELTIRGAKAFKRLSKEEQKEWQVKAEEWSDKKSDRKRKQLDAETENGAKKNGEDREVPAEDATTTEPQSKKMKEAEKTGNGPKSGTNKLLGFAFSKS